MKLSGQALKTGGNDWLAFAGPEQTSEGLIARFTAFRSADERIMIRFSEALKARQELA